MHAGKNDTRVPINPRAIVEITDKYYLELVSTHPMIQEYVKKGAGYRDIHTLGVLLALEQFLKDRHCYPDFKLVME